MGGAIYIRGKVEGHQVAKEAIISELTTEDEKTLETHLKEYCEHFNYSLDEILGGKFIKLIPTSHRPYGNLYSY